MTASRRVRTALLRLAAPFRRRHPITLARAMADGRWHYITTVHDGTTSRTYVDGVYVAERDPSDEAGA